MANKDDEQIEAENSKKKATNFEKSFNAPDLKDVSYEDQTFYFKAIQQLFTQLNIQQGKMSISSYRQAYLDKVVDMASLAVSGNVPAMDYLCFLYKRGIDDILPRNLARAHEWGLFAVANGSKLSIERLRLFFEPVYDYVIKNGDVDLIEEKNEIQDDEMGEFIAYSYANIFIDEMGLTLLEEAKKGIDEEDSFQEFNKMANIAKDKSLPKMLDLISK